MSKWTLRKEFKFEASHQLMRHDGKCANLHGHSWTGYIEIVGDMLYQDGPKTNMVMDYGDMGLVLDEMIGYLDHHHLNEVLGVDMPTSEYLAKWMYDRLSRDIPYLSAVVIRETCTTQCRYEFVDKR